MIMVVLTVSLVGCRSEVKQGRVGRVKTSSGWNKAILSPGLHSCWGFDDMFDVDSSDRLINEDMSILVGGKVNMTCRVTIRASLNLENEASALSVFEKVVANEDKLITFDSLNKIYLYPILTSVPRKIFGSCPDIQTVIANRAELADQVCKEILERAKGTPMKITAVEITNYDWPRSITDAQEELVKIQLEEERTAARVRAALKNAEGQLKIEEANKLVEIKRAEAVSESIAIIKNALKDSPEYLRWHTIRVLGEAAMGPNNAFFVFPAEMMNGSNGTKVLDHSMLKALLDAKNK